MSTNVKNMRSSGRGRITPGQIRAIWAIWKVRICQPEDVLYDLVEDISGKRSISRLTRSQAQALLDVLFEHSGQAVPGKITRSQRWKLDRLIEELGWDRPAFRAWLRKYFKIAHENWLDASRARDVLGALVRIRQRRLKKKNKACSWEKNGKKG